MNKYIMSDIADYIAAYDRYSSSFENKALSKKLTKVYNELLDIAEKNAEDYDRFKEAFTDKKIEKRFQETIDEFKTEFGRHI